MSLLVPLSAAAQFSTLIDARTPAEFAYDHLPGAINLPVLSNEERVEVGTLYAQSPFLGRQRGATLIARNIADHLEHRLSHHPAEWRPLVYCWRGGKRSGALAHILRQIGWHSGQLQGGYKAFRREVIARLDAIAPRINFVVLGGATGCRKTRLLHALAARGAQVLDLEALALHKGSLLGGQPHCPQPSQPHFENCLDQALQTINPAQVVFVEAESRRIGDCHVPTPLMQAIRAGKMVLLHSPMPARVAAILQDYQAVLTQPAWLLHKLQGLQPFHSHAQLSDWSQMAEQQQWASLAESLMHKHYDPVYQKSLAKNFHQAPVHTCTLTDEATMHAAADALLTLFQGNAA